MLKRLLRWLAARRPEQGLRPRHAAASPDLSVGPDLKRSAQTGGRTRHSPGTPPPQQPFPSGRNRRCNRAHRFAIACIPMLGLPLMLSAAGAHGADERARPISIGSKKFTESVILGETLRLLARESGYPARHRAELGGTRILWGALLNGEIDVYPEYSGTLVREILAGEDLGPIAHSDVSPGSRAAGSSVTDPSVSDTTGHDIGQSGESGPDTTGHHPVQPGESDSETAAHDAWMPETGAYGRGVSEKRLEAALAARGLRASRPLGFENTYAVAVPATVAERLNLERISDLRGHPALRFGFSSEFLDRADGWPGLRARYGLPQTRVQGLDHDLAYRAIAAGHLDVTVVYTTDAEIPRYALRLLDDDLDYFEDYRAILLYRAELEEQAPEVLAAFRRLEGRIDEARMAQLNAAVKLDGESEQAAAARLLQDTLGVQARLDSVGFWHQLTQRALEHLGLVAVSLAGAILVAVPLGIFAAQRPRIGQWVLAATGVIQTIPSLALFVFLIPWFGIGWTPTVIALFLYSLLPIVRNTYAGLRDIPAPIRESAEVIGLTRSARLRRVELPLAANTILAGIKTSAILNVGTATVAALIGAGGFGQPILTGIRLDDTALIMQGAIPAALLALSLQGLFELAERWVVPRGLRLRSPEH